jgi:hypothetical protein
MSVYESVRRSQAEPKRSSFVALALMGTAGFAASFAAGSAVLNWKSLSWPTAAVQQTCTTKADGRQNCSRTDSGWRSRVYYYFSWPSRSSDTNYRSSSLGSAKFSNAGTKVIRQKRWGTVRRSGFGTFARSSSFGRISIGG